MQAIVGAALRQRVLVVILGLAVIVGGLFAYKKLNIEAYPDPVPPLVEIVTQNPGQSSEEIERYITIPIEVQMSGLPHVQAGKLKGLAGGSAKRSPAAPDIPTIGEDLPGFVDGSWQGFLLPAKTPKPIIDTLHREITAVLKLPDVSQTFITQGGEVIASTPAEFQKAFLDDVERLGRVIRDAGIKAE